MKYFEGYDSFSSLNENVNIKIEKQFAQRGIEFDKSEFYNLWELLSKSPQLFSLACDLIWVKGEEAQEIDGITINPRKLFSVYDNVYDLF